MPVIQITMSQGRSLEQKRELVRVLTKETARILNSKEENMRVLIYEVSKENWADAGVLGIDMKENNNYDNEKKINTDKTTWAFR